MSKDGSSILALPAPVQCRFTQIEVGVHATPARFIPAADEVAVGTRISPRNPRRSRRALLTHRAPPSGSGVEAVTGQRVYRSDWRKEAGDELDEPLPAEARRLAAPLERCQPEPLHLVEEPPQARMVTRDSEVVQMPFQHLFHPSTGFRDGVVHYPAQLDL